ncbi:glycosyltransferase [Propionibacteriaceae bacterium G57]|uniref:glycosyltransferase n=1 Tax=Aestuariimicrobium sp. G57 TaxID=3418485 RepID=UPI003DA7A4B5
MTSGSENGDTQDLWAWARDPDDPAAPAAPSSRVRPEDWAWAHGRDPEPVPEIDPRRVAAVMVVHNAADWLERTLRALVALDPSPGRLIAVDTGSIDRSALLLQPENTLHPALDEVRELGPVAGFGAAASSVVDDLAEDYDWLWLLHDDVEPQPEALHHLLLRASADDHPDVLFPKLLAPHRRNHPDQVVEVGSSVSRGASRHLSHAPGEIDQGQVDATRTLGGSTAGMLVRRAVWDELGGLDPALPLFRDGQDFGWRANKAGHVVVTAPAAAVHHRQEGRFGERDSALIDGGAATDRRLGMRMVAAHADKPASAIRRLRVESAMRGVGYLLGKAPSEAMAEFRAVGSITRDASTIEAMRSRHTPAVVPADELLPSTRQVWGSRLDRLTHSAGEWRERDDDSDTSIDDLTGDDFVGGRRRARVFTAGRVFALVLVVAALLSWRQLFGRGRLVSTNLTPAPDGLTAAWQAWLHPMAGEPGANPGWLGLTALGSTLTFGQPEVFIRLLVLGAPLLGALFAYRLAARLIGPGWVAVAVASVWPALAMLSGVTSRGSVSGALLVALLPLTALAGLRWFSADDDQGAGGDHLRAPAALALWLGIAAQGEPLAALLGLGVAAAWALVHRRVGAGALIVALGPLLMLLPWSRRLAAHPGRLVTGSDPTASLPSDGGPAWQVLLGRAGLGGLPPIGVSIGALVGLALVTAMAVLLGRRRLSPVVVACFTIPASLAVVVAAWSTRVLVRIDGQQVRPSVDLWLLLAGGLVMVLALLALRPVHLRRREHLTQGTLATALAAALVGALGLVWGIVGQSSSPLQVRPDPLPAYVSDVQSSTRASRALVVQVDGTSHRWTLTEQGRPGWGSGEAYPVLGSPTQATGLAGLAARVAGGSPGDDLAGQLSGYAISHLVVRGADQQTVLGISNAPGLTAATLDANTTVWTVQGLVSRLSMTNPDGTTVSLPDARVGRAGELRLAEPADDRWVVTVGGTDIDMTAAPSGFGLTGQMASGVTGEVVWRTRTDWAAVIGHGLVLAGLLVLTAPTVRRQGARPPTRSLETPRRGQ